MKLKDSRQLARGMTLIEIMIVIAILGLIASAVAVNAFSNYRDAQRQRAALDIKNIETALKLHLVKRGSYPDPANGLAGLNLESTRDPWGNDYVYALESSKPIIRSNGPPGGSAIVACPDGCPSGYASVSKEEK